MQRRAGWRSWVGEELSADPLKSCGVLVPPVPSLTSASGFNFAEAQKETWDAPTHKVSNLACTLMHGRNQGTLSQDVNI